MMNDVTKIVAQKNGITYVLCMRIEANAARAIKAVPNTPQDIPEGVEVIDVCKAIEEMMNESEERGECRMLVKQVRKGRITIEQAAENANMSVEQFKNVISHFCDF